MTGPALAYFAGDDTWSLERAAEGVAERLVADAGIPLERWRVSGDSTSIGAINERIATAPLFGGGTLVVVREPAPLVRRTADRAALVAAVNGVAPGNGLVFLESGDGSGRRSAALEAVRRAVQAAGGEVRDFRFPREGQLSAWIEARAGERGIRLAPGTARALATRIGGFVREGDVDRRRQGELVVGELDKLALYRLDAPVTPDDVAALVPEAVPGSTWAFLDAIGIRDAAGATRVLERLLPSTPEPVLLAVVHRRLRELLEVADRLAAGEAPGTLVRSMHLKPFRAEQLARQARTWTVAELAAALEGLLDLDMAVKGVPGRSVGEAQRRLGFSLWLADHLDTGRSRARAGR
jgi:DNA polymerase-3 subunit delta